MSIAALSPKISTNFLYVISDTFFKIFASAAKSKTACSSGFSKRGLFPKLIVSTCLGSIPPSMASGA